MSYRDDGDAALARADALQHEVDEYQASVASLRERLAALEAERARLAKLAHEDPPPVEPEQVVETRPMSAETVLICGLMLIAALFALVMLAAPR